MSMYTYILEAALRERPQPDARLATGDALVVLLECRRYLGSIASSDRSSDWGSTALANQVAYDLALIDLARSVGIFCDSTSFDQPQRRRIELERELSSRGIALDELGQQANST
ncbi:MAG: hypothetical protein ABSH29_14895 [Acidimicrobiales bacterium]